MDLIGDCLEMKNMNNDGFRVWLIDEREVRINREKINKILLGLRYVVRHQYISSMTSTQRTIYTLLKLDPLHTLDGSVVTLNISRNKNPILSVSNQ